jgi:excisionase family DNA binding protein
MEADQITAVRHVATSGRRVDVLVGPAGSGKTTTLSALATLQDREPMLTVAQVAELLCTPERFVRRLVAERRIGFTKVGRYVRFTLADVEQFTNAGRVDPIDPWATNRNTHRAS